MSLSKNKLIKDILDKPTIFICGEDEVLSQHSVQQILKLKLEKPLEHLYFINPPKKTIELLEQETIKQNYTIVQNVEEINNFSSFNIIACGIQVDSIEFGNKAKKNKNHEAIFFNQLGLFRKSWEELGTNIWIIEQSLNNFILDIEPPKPHYAEPLHKSQRKESEVFFTNRGKALTLYRDFKADRNKRCAIIIGVKGIGKRAFINKLKNIGLIKEVSHYCISKNDDLTYVLKCLLGRFNVEYRDSEIPTYFDAHRVDPILKKLFSAFDREENANLIFYNTDILYNKHKKGFYDTNLEVFFKHLLQRPSYRGNKVYLTSEFDFLFSAISPGIFQTIYLGAMTAEYIKYILEHEFGKPERDSSAFATAIMQFQDKTIDKLIGGYPPVAHIFVNTCIEYSMDEVINKGFAYAIFEEKKLKELKEFITLNDSEVAILGYLSLFRKHFTVEAAQVFHSNASNVLEQLRQRMLIEKVIYETHTVFYVPSFIQDYVLSISSEDSIIKTNHNKIGDYYWNCAENKNKKYYEQLEDYRLALYHYESAGNTAKQQLLITRFTGIFLNTAYELYKDNKMEEAYSAYEFLYEHGCLTNVRHLNSFLTCNAKLKKEGTRELFETISGKFAKEIFIQTSYANYLYSIGDYNLAEKICLDAKAIKKDNSVISLYAKIIFKKGEKERAFEILEDVTKGLLSKTNRRTKDTKDLITSLMTQYTLIDYYTAVKTAIQQIGLYLKLDGMTSERIIGLTTQPVPANAEARIIEYFEKAANHKHATRLLSTSYSNFLIRQRKNDESFKILTQKHPRVYLHGADSHDIYSPKFGEVIQTENQFLFNDLNNPDLEENNKLECVLSDNKVPSGEIGHASKKKIYTVPKKFHETEIQNILTSCKKKIEQAQAKLDAIIAIEPNHYSGLSTRAICVQQFEYLMIFENAANDYYRLNAEQREMKNDIEQTYLAGSPISAQKKGHEVIRRLNEMNINLNNYGFLNLGGGDGTELFVEIENSVSKFGLLMEYDHNSVKSFFENQSKFNLINHNRIVHTEVMECDLGDKKKFDSAKQLIKDNNLDGLVITIHAVLHELTTRSHFKPFDFITFFMRIYDLHDNIILFIREPGIPENWSKKIKIVLKEEYRSDFVSILKRVNEIHFKNESSNYELFDTNEIICTPVLAIEALTNFFYKEDFEYEKDEHHTSITKADLVSNLRSSNFEILESEPFYTDSMKRNIQHYEVKVSGLNGEHISLPQCFTYTVAKKGSLSLIRK